MMEWSIDRKDTDKNIDTIICRNKKLLRRKIIDQSNFWSFIIIVI